MAIFVAIALATGGCGGINASQSVSPLDFLLPGILKNSPAPANPEPVGGINNSNIVASAR
ncbi:MAG TPA: hypothetical protein VNZ25_04235 [Candidatus Angelobacter sp.]|jgi:hypothetical protein|nr:hypothetical protein [Candidatus Angelobacter sp.]